MESKEREVERMTDGQFLNHLREILLIAKSSNNLSEFIAKLEKLIEQYTN